MQLLPQPSERLPSGNYPEGVMPAGKQVERALKASRGLTVGGTGQAEVSEGHLHGAVSIVLGTRLWLHCVQEVGHPCLRRPSWAGGS